MLLRDIPKNNNTAEKNTRIKYRVYPMLLTDIDYENWPKAVNATISTNVLSAGKTHHYIDCRVDSIKPSAAAGASQYDLKQTVALILDGISKSTLQYVYDIKGLEVVLIWERCSDGQKFIAGSPCSNGLTVKVKTIGDVSNISGAELSLEGGDCPEPFWFYDGPIIREDPLTIQLADGTTFGLGVISLYLLTDNATAKTLTDITGVTDADVGRIIELQGAGVVFPTVINNSDKFILKSGVSFSAKVGNSISFAITKTGTGYAFYEVYRS